MDDWDRFRSKRRRWMRNIRRGSWWPYGPGIVRVHLWRFHQITPYHNIVVISLPTRWSSCGAWMASGWTPRFAAPTSIYFFFLVLHALPSFSSHFVLLSNWVFAVWVGTSKHIQSPSSSPIVVVIDRHYCDWVYQQQAASRSWTMPWFPPPCHIRKNARWRHAWSAPRCVKSVAPSFPSC